MKKLLYLLFFLPVVIMAQARYGVEGVPMCWTTAGGIDSSITRYVLISTTGKPVKTIVYENAYGVVVNMSGGTVKYGFCDCGGGIDSLSNNSVTFNKVSNSVKDSFTVYYASTAQIAAMPRAFVGQRLKLRGSGAEYLVSNDSIAGYLNDGKAVVKITALNKYAVIEQSQNGYNVDWFGAIPNDALTDDDAIQRCIDFCLLNVTGVKNSSVLFSPGNYTLTKGVVAAKLSGGSYQTFSINFIGLGATPYSGVQSQGRQSVLEVKNKNGFGLGIIKGRTILIKGLAFNGTAPLVTGPSLSNVLNWSESQWTQGGQYRNNGYSPYAGIVIDFPSSTIDADSYPDFTSYYGAAASGGGTSMITITDCVVQGFMVGIAHSISKNLQNGDNLKVSNIYALCNKSFFVSGQDQTRGNSIDNVYGLFNEVFVDCQRYGRQIGTPPTLSNCNIAGGTKCIARLSSGNRANFSMSDSYAESVFQLVIGSANPVTISNTAIDFQFEYRQPDFHILSDANFDNCILKFYGGEDSHSLWVDGTCSFNQSIIGARGVYRYLTNAGGEYTDRMSFIDCMLTGRDQASNAISQVKNRGNQINYSNGNFIEVLGYPMDGNRISGRNGFIEVYDQPLYNVAQYGPALLKVTSTKAYLVSSNSRGKVTNGDAISGSYVFSNTGGVLIAPSISPTPIGTVSTVSGDTIFFTYNSIPFNLKDTTIGAFTVMTSPSSNLPIVASGTLGLSYILVKTPHSFTGLLRPNRTGIPIGCYVTRISISNDTLFLSLPLTSTFLNEYVYFFKSKTVAYSRSTTDFIFQPGDRVIENGVEYVCISAGQNGTSVTPVFVKNVLGISSNTQLNYGDINGNVVSSPKLTYNGSGGLKILHSAPTAGDGGMQIANSSTNTGGFATTVLQGTNSSVWNNVGQGLIVFNHSRSFEFTVSTSFLDTYHTQGWFGSNSIQSSTEYAILSKQGTNILGLTAIKYASSPYPEFRYSATKHIFYAKSNAAWPDGNNALAYGTPVMGVHDTGVKIGSAGTSANAVLDVTGDCIITSSLWLNSAKTVGILSGTGTPEGAITASVGSTFIRTDGGAGTSFYVKETGTGNTGWIAK